MLGSLGWSVSRFLLKRSSFAVAFEKVCDLDDLWEGEMEAFTVAGCEIVVLHAEGGAVRAILASCPHQEHPLIEGELDGRTLTCKAHSWEFDVCTGKGINPDDAQLVNFAVRVENDEVFVDLTQQVVPGDRALPCDDTAAQGKVPHEG